MAFVDVIAMFARTLVSFLHVRSLAMATVPLGTAGAASCLGTPGTMSLSVAACSVANGAGRVGILVDGMHNSHD